MYFVTQKYKTVRQKNSFDFVFNISFLKTQLYNIIKGFYIFIFNKK